VTDGRRPRFGVTLPQFRDDVGPLLAVARAAEDAGLDGVFVFDHLFRLASDGTPRPALEMAATIGAVAAETDRLTIGTLVARVPLRPSAVLAAVFETARRIAGDRIVAGLGVGDHESRPEHEQFGPPYESVASRVARLGEAITAVRAVGVPVWVGGRHPDVVALALEQADGWNRWGGDAAEVAAAMATDARAASARAAPDRAASDRAAPARAADARAAPDRAASDRAAPDRAASDRAAPDRAASDRAGFATSWGAVIGLAEVTAADVRRWRSLDVDWVILGDRRPGDVTAVHHLGDLLRGVGTRDRDAPPGQ
jgi:alkanesulfonate monooxygenase SsuD/methylene tetrahydromethanopterin reductase-like flavin-dependent oxidoreductase (luciferase family)